MVDTKGDVHTSLVLAKTRVAPVKRLSIPRLELCGAQLLAQILHHCQVVLNLQTEVVFAWTDSTFVLSWIFGNPRQFKTYVGNRVLHIIQLIAPNRWNHVEGANNLADCASHGLLPSELLSHQLWWEGPGWLRLGIHCWPEMGDLSKFQPALLLSSLIPSFLVTIPLVLQNLCKSLLGCIVQKTSCSKYWAFNCGRIGTSRELLGMCNSIEFIQH